MRVADDKNCSLGARSDAVRRNEIDSDLRAASASGVEVAFPFNASGWTLRVPNGPVPRDAGGQHGLMLRRPMHGACAGSETGEACYDNGPTARPPPRDRTNGKLDPAIGRRRQSKTQHHTRHDRSRRVQTRRSSASARRLANATGRANTRCGRRTLLAGGRANSQLLRLAALRRRQAVRRSQSLLAQQQERDRLRTNSWQERASLQFRSKLLR